MYIVPVATKQEIEDRKNEIRQLLVVGGKRHEVITHLIKHFSWAKKLSQSTWTRYFNEIRSESIVHVESMITSDSNEYFVMFSDHIERLRELYRHAVNNGDLGEARKVLQQITTTMGFDVFGKRIAHAQIVDGEKGQSLEDATVNNFFTVVQNRSSMIVSNDDDDDAEDAEVLESTYSNIVHVREED